MKTIHSAVHTATTALFVPGNKPEWFSKGVSSGADLILIDWEDSVPPTDKAAARTVTISALANETLHGPDICAMVRIDPSRAQADLALLAMLASRPGNGLLGAMLPKSHSVDAVCEARRLLPQSLAIVPLIESALGVSNVDEIASVRGIDRLAFGAFDFALDVSAKQDGPLLDYARSKLVIASTTSGLPPPLDSPIAEFGDMEAVALAATRADAFGFGGMMCIHPDQVAVVASAFKPDEAEIEWARKVIEAGAGFGRIATQMVDLPVQTLARRISQRSLDSNNE